MSSLYSSSLASFRTSCDVDNITKDYDSGKATFLSFLAVVQALKIDFLPMTWDAGRDDIGFGATSRVNETHINIHTSFALKRVNRHKSEEQIFRSCTKEITVLAHKSVREHPNIAQLQGICWDVSAFDDKPWPVLVFEKTHLGDLYEFAMLPAGRTMSFSQRLRLCMDMGRAIMDMHSMSKCSHFERARTSYFNFIDIVHGDIKPDNVLVFTEESGQYKARVTDFGYSSRFTNDEDRLKLPISVPWNAPEVDRLNREWTPSQAKQADLFSFGMLCVWLVFETYFSGSTKPPADVQLPVFISSTAVEQTKLVLLQVKGKLQMYIPYLLAAEDNLDHQTIAALEKFLVSCLSKDPDERLAPIRELLEQLAPEK
jgi:serine/threonine protein kinase